MGYQKKKHFNRESLLVEEGFLILWPTRYNHLVKASEICNWAGISLGCGPRCSLLWMQKEFSSATLFPVAVSMGRCLFLLTLNLFNLSWKIIGANGNLLKPCPHLG